MGHLSPAPGDLDLVRRFVNTLDIEQGRERLDSPAALGAWLADAELLAAGTPLDAADLRDARALREALRDVLAVNNGAPADASSLAALADLSARAPLAVRFGEDAGPRLEPAGEGFGAAVARLLGICARAQADGTWQRMKACPAHDCRWAFYDRSRNRSRTWCTMDICGNRAKARAYRERATANGGTT